MVVKQVLEGGLYASYTCIRGAHMLVIQVLEGAHMLVIQVLEGLICSSPSNTCITSILAPSNTCITSICALLILV
jgi:hypothetical protein